MRRASLPDPKAWRYRNREGIVVSDWHSGAPDNYEIRYVASIGGSIEFDASEGNGGVDLAAIMREINGLMHEGQCPTAGSIGECAAIWDTRPGWWMAALYIWDAEFNDSTRVAEWFHAAGATNVLVEHTLYDEGNGDRDGKCIDGARAWHVTFSTREEVTTAPIKGGEPS